MGPPPSFAADSMLGSLARWLRLLGYDCFYEADIADAKLLEISRAQGRIVLTRDRLVARKAPTALFIERDDLDGQLLTVLGEFKLQVPDEPPTTRCSMCNALLLPAKPEDLGAAGVPDRVRALHQEFWLCPACKRIYWKGTHVDSMGQRLRSLKERMASAATHPNESA